MTQTVYVAGGQSKEWKTCLYCVPLLKNIGTMVKVMAIGMDKITKDLEAIDHQSANGLFPDVDSNNLV